MFSNFWFLLREFSKVPFDVLRGVQRRRYVHAYDVEAPKDLAWQVVSAHKITLDGTPPVEIDTDPDPARPGVYRGFCRAGDTKWAFAYRVLEERPGEALTLAILPEESDPVYNFGDNYISAMAVNGDAAKATVTGSYDLTHTRLMTRFLVPIALVSTGQRIKRTIESRAGVAVGSTTESQIKAALLTGALTFASFFALFGPSAAAMLLFLILIHELGHVIAMRWAGIPVKGIYFVPFFGGVAVGGSGAKSEIGRGLVALMGPGFSLATTAVFAWLDAQNPGTIMRDLTLMSALLNGFNLLPIHPLDGGHISHALLSRAGAEAARSFRVVALFAGGSLALWAGDYLLLGLLVLLAPSIASSKWDETARLAPLTNSELVWLAVAYAATFVFYATVIMRVWGAPAP